MRLLAALSLIAVTGCSATVDEPIDEAGNLLESQEVSLQASVRIESSTTLLQERGAVGTPARMRSRVSARFLRVTGLDGQLAQQMVGATVDESDAPLGCTYADAELPAVMNDGASIEMLDVGDILVHVLSGGSPADVDWTEITMPLAARAFPDVGELVSGVVYTSRDEATPVVDAGSYVIEASGSAAMDGFKLEVEAPAAPEDVRVGGETLEEGLMLASGEAVALSWAADVADSADRIIVEITDAGSPSAAGVRCVFADDGAATIPESFASYTEGSELEVAVRRHRRSAVKLPGVDEAYVDFDFGVATHASVE
jgi:hypothetical protein